MGGFEALRVIRGCEGWWAEFGGASLGLRGGTLRRARGAVASVLNLPSFARSLRLDLSPFSLLASSCSAFLWPSSRHFVSASCFLCLLPAFACGHKLPSLGVLLPWCCLLS